MRADALTTSTTASVSLADEKAKLTQLASDARQRLQTESVIAALKALARPPGLSLFGPSSTSDDQSAQKTGGALTGGAAAVTLLDRIAKGFAALGEEAKNKADSDTSNDKSSSSSASHSWSSFASATLTPHAFGSVPFTTAQAAYSATSASSRL